MANLRVHKFPLASHGVTRIQAPLPLQPLVVNYDLDDQLCLWGVVDIDSPIETDPESQPQVHVFYTGEEVPSALPAGLSYVGTVVDAHLVGGLVLHAFMSLSDNQQQSVAKRMAELKEKVRNFEAPEPLDV